MKKILSVITAVSLAMATMLSVSAKEKITSDEVMDMIYSTGLSAYPELRDMVITDDSAEQDVLKPETRTVKDVIDINKSYLQFFIENSSGKYSINYDDDISLNFRGLNDDGKRVNISVNGKNFILDELAGEAHYVVENDIVELPHSLIEDHDRIAKIINESDISDVKEIKYINYGKTIFFSAVYITDSKKHEYAIPTSSYTDNHAESMGIEAKSISEGTIMKFDEWCSCIDAFNKSFEENENARPQYEKINGDEIRDTDTRAAYIGTESRFVDVSGDLVSYVNELNDLGIISGYDDGTFLPGENITRAEAAAMLARMLRLDGSYSGGYKDVSSDDWFADDVASLTAKGLINGYGENTFAPYSNITYQEVMKILVLALGHLDNDYLNTFDGAYPAETNKTAMKLGLTDGLDSFDTIAAITRGDMAIMLSNALDTHMMTYVKMISQNGTGGGIGKDDITLIDYLNGGKLNGNILN